MLNQCKYIHTLLIKSHQLDVLSNFVLVTVEGIALHPDSPFLINNQTKHTKTQHTNIRGMILYRYQFQQYKYPIAE